MSLSRAHRPRAEIFVGLTHTEYWPVTRMPVGLCTQADSIIVSRSLATPARIGELARRALELYATTRSITGWKLVHVADLFPPPPVAVPDRIDCRQMYITIEERDAFYGISPHTTTREGFRPLNMKVVVSSGCSDAALGRAIRRAALLALASSLLHGLAFAPIHMIDAIARKTRRLPANDIS